MTDVDHWAESGSDKQEYECDDCDEAFCEEDDLRDHEVKEHFYCDPCDRYFQDWNRHQSGVFPLSPFRLTVLTNIELASTWQDALNQYNTVPIL